MTYKLVTRYAPCMVQIIVLTKSAEMLCLKVYDPNQKNTVFTERKKNNNWERITFCTYAINI